MKSTRRIALFLLATVLLSACQLTAPLEADSPQNAPQAVFTAAAGTAQARLAVLDLTQTALPTRTPLPTLPPTETPTISPTAEVLTGTLVGPVTIIPGDDRAEYITDLSIPDGTVFRPGESFTKSWRIKNAGQTTWTGEYALVFAGGDLMGATLSKPFSTDVFPGQTVDISADFVAPPVEGSFKGYWALRNAEGRLFGVGENADEAFWVSIIAQGAPVTSTPGPTEAQGLIGALVLSVNEPSYSGACPHTLLFKVEVTMNEPDFIQYVFNSENDADAELNLPPSLTYVLEAGQHSAIFELTVTESMNGWLQIVINNPVLFESNRVEFQVTCQ